MLLPNQLKNVSFQSAGRGVYRAQEVDEFQQRVYAAYSELYSENSLLKKKFASLSALVEEYNEGKNSIANAIIKSQAMSDKMIAEAQKQAEDLMAEAKAKAEAIIEEARQKSDEYIAEKTSTADAYLLRAETELDRVKKEAEEAAADYAEKVNEKAQQIIAKANEQACTIVSAAYADAKLAREKCDEIISTAKEELAQVKKDISLFKVQTEKMISVVVPALEKIQVPDELDMEVSDPEPEATENADSVSEGEPLERFEYQPSEPKSPIDEEAKAVEPFDEDAYTETDGMQLPQEKEEPSDSDDLDSYFSSILNSLNEEESSDENESDGSDSENADSNDGDIAFSGPKGYNGNNTSFAPSSRAGFVITDFDDEEE